MLDTDLHIPGYDIIERIGKGGMASVYRARQHSFDRNVALKILKPDLSEDDVFCQRFLSESLIVAKLSHSNIVQVYDVGEVQNNYFIAMEFLSKGDLSHKLKQGIDLREALKIITQMASALDFAHRKGIIHRDIKPDNVMFREDGAAVVTDFGIAKETGSDMNLTQTGLVVGTPRYMSPEQVKGGKVGPEADIYSLGVVFYQLLTNRFPFDGDSMMSIAFKHINEPIPKFPEALSQFQPILEKMLAKSVDDRYKHGNDIVDDIRELEEQKKAYPKTPVRERPIEQSIADDAATIVDTKLASDILETTHKPRALEDSGAAATVIKPQKPQSNRDLSQQETQVSSTNETLYVPPSAAPPSASPSDKTEYVPRAETIVEPVSHPESAPTEVSRGKIPHSSMTDKTETRPIPSPFPKQALGALGGLSAIAVVAIAAYVILGNDSAENTSPPPSKEIPVSVEDSSIEIQRLMQMVDVDIQNNRLRKPDTNNAYDKLKTILSLHPEHPEALQKMRMIAERYISLSQNSLSAAEFKESESYLNQAKSIISEVKGLDRQLTLSVKYIEDELLTVKNASSKRKETILTLKQSLQIEGLLQSAAIDESEGRLHSPAGNNAAEKYRKVLDIDPNNTQAKTKLASIENR